MQSEFFQPDEKCLLCNSKAALTINTAYAEGGRDLNVKQFCAMYEVDFEKLTGEKLTKKIVDEHFEKHCNAKALALKKFNQMKSEPMTDIQQVNEVTTEIIPQQHDELYRIHALLADNYVNDLTILDFSVKEQLHHLVEIREVKAERRVKGVGVVDLIMKEEDILRSVQFSLLNKIKIFQTGKLQQAQAQVLNSTNFLNASTMKLMNVDETGLTQAMMKRSQDLFVSTIFSHFLKRLNICLKDLNLTSVQKALFLSNFKKELEGIETEIYKDFENSIKSDNIVDADFESNMTEATGENLEANQMPTDSEFEETIID